MAKKQKTTPSRGNTTKASASQAPRRPERSIDMLTASRDPALIVKTLRDNWSGSLAHQRPPIKSDATGGKGDTRWMSLGFGDVRASGQFLSMGVDLYS